MSDFNPYTIDKISDNIFYIKDNDENRQKLFIYFGDLFDFNYYSVFTCVYIRIDFNLKQISSSLTYEWMYRNSPTLSTIEELVKNLRCYKIKKIKDRL